MKRPRISLTPSEAQEIEEIAAHDKLLKHMTVEEVGKLLLKSKVAELKEEFKTRIAHEVARQVVEDDGSGKRICFSDQTAIPLLLGK